jgi:very-short-patch-repair endonuclease/predicted transcriptional regulator of viral defense system
LPGILGEVVGSNSNIVGDTSHHPAVGRVDQWLDSAIAAVAVRQQGNITRQQLLALGANDKAIAYRVKIGRLYRVYRGVYSVGRPPVTPLPRACAAVLACGPGAALSHGSATTLWGLGKHWHTPFEVVVPRDRRQPGITVHRSSTLAHRDITTHNGVRVTTPARTLVDLSPRLTDKRLTRAVNDALHSRYMRRSDLAEILTRLPNYRVAKRLARFVDNQTGITRSDLEDAFAALCEHYDIPRPQFNAPIAGYTVDAWFPNERLIVELDSYEFHNDHDTFESDRNRDADTLLAGLPTVRVTHERMTATPDHEAARLHAILDARRAILTSRGSHPATRPEGRLK